jgi:hypothetical protein
MLVVSRHDAIGAPSPGHSQVILTIPPSDEPRTVIFDVVELRGLKVRIGITADQEINIVRGELLDQARAA